MGYSIGYNNDWKRWIGYGVPAYCDHPDCNEKIDRGMAYVCEGDRDNDDEGCGLYFCPEHLFGSQECDRCSENKEPFIPKAEHPEWVNHLLTDESWEKWRNENPEKAKELQTI